MDFLGKHPDDIKEFNRHDPNIKGKPKYDTPNPKETISNKDLDMIIKRATGDKSPLQEVKYLTSKEFTKRFALALEEFLSETLGKGESHINDHACQSVMFSEAFAHIVNNFS